MLLAQDQATGATVGHGGFIAISSSADVGSSANFSRVLQLGLERDSAQVASARAPEELCPKQRGISTRVSEHLDIASLPMYLPKMYFMNRQRVTPQHR